MIPRTMSTQHPDNVRAPFFASNSILEGDDEIKEAFYCFSHIGSREQLWDFEGKEVDNYVVKKLLTRYEPFFSKNKLGKDFRLTLRVPNPECEKNEAKILLETLESIPRSYDVAKAFYGELDVAPIFEVAQPMTTNAISLRRIRAYYKKFVVEKQDNSLISGDVKIREWIGEFNPKQINVIPLFEDLDSILNSAKITGEFLHGEKVGSQRVWLARSDPALNYGSLSAVIMNKIALQRLHDLQEEVSIEILPILGTGSAPFRGNLKPTNAAHILKGYPSVQTFTIQSAFKYDFPEEQVVGAIELIESSKRGKPMLIDDEKKALEILKKVAGEYAKQVALLAPFINDFAPFIPQRRKRKLHVGLFGYSRQSGGGLKLPRAITFSSVLYSVGLPPELLGLSKLTEKDLDFLRTILVNLDNDMADSLQFLNNDNLHLFPKQVEDSVENVAKMFGFETDSKHKKATSIIVDNLKTRSISTLQENIVRAGSIRGFLG